MRKEAKTPKTTTIARVSSYHATSSYHVNYAFQGWSKNKYFTSDRYMELDAHFRRADSKPLKGYGLEIETECNGIVNRDVYAEMLQKVIFSHFPADLFKLQSDSSLCGGRVAAEAITQVMTKEFIRNNYAAFKLMYDTYFPAFEISCSRSGNCGMHVNISNGAFGRTQAAQELAVKKLLYMANKHFGLMCALTCRSLARTTYCSRMHTFAIMENCKSADLNHMPASHGISCNFSHFPEGRIELRFVGGQPNFAAFRNTMESVFHLVEAAKTLTWQECDDVVAIFSGCNQYVYDRLKSKVRSADAITEEQLEAIRATVKREELL